MNGGAVIADRSPVKPANLRGIGLLINVSHQTNNDGRSRLQKARPATLLSCRYSLGRSQCTRTRTCNIRHLECFRLDLRRLFDGLASPACSDMLVIGR